MNDLIGMKPHWINTKVEFIWDGSQYVEHSVEGYWYEGEITFCANYDSTNTGANIDSAVNQIIDSSTDLNVDSNSLVVDKSANNVGIGVTAPGDIANGLSLVPDLEIRGAAGTGAACAGVLALTTAETSTVDADVLGAIVFQAPIDGSGTDAILSGAAIWAEADATFSSSVNNTELVFATNTSAAATERMRINAAGDVLIANGGGFLVGHTAQETISIGDGATDLVPEVQVLGTGQVDSTLMLASFSATATSAGAPMLALVKGGNASIGSHTVVTDGEELGNIIAFGDDGTDLEAPAAMIQFEVDGTPGTGDMPGRIIFATTTNAGETLTERMRITNAGFVNVGTTTVAPSYPMNVCRADAGYVQRNVAAHASQTGAIYAAGTWRSANSAYDFFVGTSGNDGTDFGADTEHQLRGDGASYNRTGTYTSADYAEFFETVDGNSIESGVTVKLNNGKIEPCEEDDVPIGVVRPSDASADIGNSAWSIWNGKYLRDDFGSYIREEISVKEWTDEDDKKYSYPLDMIPDDITVPEDAEIITHDGDGNRLDRRKPNPDYDESVTYVNRQDRDEWCIVGLLGQVQIIKGQPVADNWVKMKDVSDAVEMWFVK